MTEETNGSPVAEPELPATEVTAQETPEIAEPETDEAAERDDPERSVKRMERRIGRLTEKRYQAEARADRAEAEAAQLRAHYQQETRTDSDPRQITQADIDRIAHEKADRMVSVREVNRIADQVAADGSKRFKHEFGVALTAFRSEVDPLFRSDGSPTDIGEAVLASKDPAGLIRHIGLNPELAADFERLSPVRKAMRIADIASEMSSPRETKQSTAPKPISPARAAVRDSGGLSDDLPIEEWAKRFQKQRHG